MSPRGLAGCRIHRLIRRHTSCTEIAVIALRPRPASKPALRRMDHDPVNGRTRAAAYRPACQRKNPPQNRGERCALRAFRGDFRDVPQVRECDGPAEVAVLLEAEL